MSLFFEQILNKNYFLELVAIFTSLIIVTVTFTNFEILIVN